MFRNYVKIAFRNLIKHKQYSLINILGLAIGLACFVLIMLWVQDELSYDQFHKNADDIYIVFRRDKGGLVGVTTQPLGGALKTDLPEVVEATSIAILPISSYIRYDNNGFDESFALTDAQFFKIFSFDFKKGNPQSAFENPNSIILTEKMRKKYFGDKDALGESLTLTFLGQKRPLRVTGILENLPHNSHFQREFFIPFDFLKSYGLNLDNWNNQATETFIMTRGKINVPNLEKRILACKEKYRHEEKVSYSVLPLSKIHIHTSEVQFFSSTGDIKYVYIFSVIAGIILLIACINYMNLSNALSLKRIREIGIKKVVGARWGDLIRQHFGETFILTFLAMICAILIVELLLPVLNRLAGKSLVVNYYSPKFLIVILVTILITTLVSGLYPALFITKFQPIKVLKQKVLSQTNGFNLQKGLVIFQFTLSIIIIICTVIVAGQLNFIKNTELGYDKENIICLKLKSDISAHYNAFKNKLLANHDILNVCRSQPFAKHSLGRSESIDWPGKKEKYYTWILHVDADFAATYKIEMQQGRFYSDAYSSDRTSACVLNEAAIKEMGLEAPVGKEITVWGRPGTIIGIAKDFHFNSLHHVIEPLVFRLPAENEQNTFYRELSIRIRPNSVQQSLAFLENTWNSFFPNEPFDFYFFDDQLNASYLAEQRMGDIFKYFSFLAIFIACLGLYGLTAFMIERKIKDIGIHKVLGAGIARIVFLLSKKYLWWIIFANAIAWPIAYYAMNRWLQNFAYRIDIGWWTFLLAGAMALLIALLTVSYQAIKAALANPVESLRYE
jgi:putative ABC transport system permease protein